MSTHSLSSAQAGGRSKCRHEALFIEVDGSMTKQREVTKDEGAVPENNKGTHKIHASENWSNNLKE